MWVGLELCSISFLRFLKITEFQLKYFILQAIGSLILVSSSIYCSVVFFFLAVVIKSLIFPFFLWVYPRVKKLPPLMIVLFFTIIKLAPLSILFYLDTSTTTKMIILIFVVVNILVGVTGGVWRREVGKLMIFSASSQTGWIMLSILISKIIFFFYIRLYILSILLFILNSIAKYQDLNRDVFILFLFIGSLPPSIFFFLKLIILFNMIGARIWLIIFFLLLVYSGIIFIYISFFFVAFLQKKNLLFHCKFSVWWTLLSRGFFIIFAI